MFPLDIKQSATVLLVILLVILTLAEMFISYRENRNFYKKTDTFQNIYLSGLAFLMNLASKGLTFFILNYFYKFRLMEIENVLIYWLVLIVLQDFLYWVLHYLGHISRIFWAMHVTHHSSEHFNLTTGFRSTVFEPLYRVFFYIPLAIFGFSAMDILYAYLITQLYGNLVHTQLEFKFPKWYSYIFVTPSHHRVHHASNIAYLDKNMGMVFILWDRIFKTFRAEDLDEEIKYGLTKQPLSQDPVSVVFHEWKNLWTDIEKAPDLKNKFKYLIKPPGWSHLDDSQTSRSLQNSLTEKNKFKL